MIALRPASVVMRLERLGASHQTRLSFMRVLLRKMVENGWQTDRPVWNIAENGTGYAVYRVRGSGQTYSLVAFAHDLPADQRSDRVIATAWDATFALIDGEALDTDIARLAANVPKQEAGRVSDRELVLSRANKSVRLWDHVVEALAAGRQPDRDHIAAVGYLMRTTAVYGSGKFGAADFQTLRTRPVIGGPFRAEMLSVWLIRAFVMDLVEHMARVMGGAQAAQLAPNLRRLFGIGNSTGLGMAPFLVNHPMVLNAWISARETALARVRALPVATATTRKGLRDALAQARGQADCWFSDHLYQQQKIAAFKADLQKLDDHLVTEDLDGERPWDRLFRWGVQALSLEGQEALVSLLLEPHGQVVDELADAMAINEDSSFFIQGSMLVADLQAHLTSSYTWALGYQDTRKQAARFWYASAAKMEPRLGERFAEPGAALELPLATARDIAALAAELQRSDACTVAAFLQKHPQHRHSVRRAQRNMSAPYSEVQGNLTAHDMLPIDLLRSKLAFFGATRFDPRSDRWLRITMFQDAPFPDELNRDGAGGLYASDWVA